MCEKNELKTAVIYLFGGYIADTALALLSTQLRNHLPARIQLAADCGLELADRLGQTPDLLLGDMDSIDERALARFGADRILRSPSRKDQTDAQLAVREAVSRGYGRIILAGGLGGRVDHTLANIGCLGYIRANGADGVIMDGQNKIRLFGAGRHEIVPSPGAKYVSVVPAGGSLHGLTLEGFAYPLEHAEMDAWDFSTVSNEYASACPVITLECGEFLLTETFP